MYNCGIVVSIFDIEVQRNNVGFFGIKDSRASLRSSKEVTANCGLFGSPAQSAQL